MPFTSVHSNLEHGLAILTESVSPLRSVLHNLSCWSPKQKWCGKLHYRSGTVNSKSFVGKVFLRIKRKFELIYVLLFEFYPKLWIRNYFELKLRIRNYFGLKLRITTDFELFLWIVASFDLTLWIRLWPTSN